MRPIETARLHDEVVAFVQEHAETGVTVRQVQERFGWTSEVARRRLNALYLRRRVGRQAYAVRYFP